MAHHRVKLSKICDLGQLVDHIWGTFHSVVTKGILGLPVLHIYSTLKISLNYTAISHIPSFGERSSITSRPHGFRFSKIFRFQVLTPFSINIKGKISKLLLPVSVKFQPNFMVNDLAMRVYMLLLFQHFISFSIYGYFGVILCTCLKLPKAENSCCRAKATLNVEL